MNKNKFRKKKQKYSTPLSKEELYQIEKFEIDQQEKKLWVQECIMNL